MTVLIAGAGIAGLTMGLTLQLIGVPFRIYEAVSHLRPLGVGINIQPNAVRELYELGLEPALKRCGVETREYGFFTRDGQEIWTEPRGVLAGYHWPQFSLHRGKLQMELLDALIGRAGPEAVVTGCRVKGFETRDDHTCLRLAGPSGDTTATGKIILAADGINSAIRAQMYPDEGEPIWNGAIMWRAISPGKPFRSGASMIMAGNDTIRFVAYPITPPDTNTGLTDINWIAELRQDPGVGWRSASYDTSTDVGKFLPSFVTWNFGWLDCPTLISAAGSVFEYPMIDRDPLPRWTQGRVTLMGDAAHPAYPVGSNGASQAIVDARLIGSMFQKYGVGEKALGAYESRVREKMAKVVAANRSGTGPDGVMQLVEDRCAGDFSNIKDAVPHAELAAHAAKYKALSGFSIDELNKRPSLIAS